MTKKPKGIDPLTGQQVFFRDGRSPIPKSELISRVMSANKGKNTKPEVILRKCLWHQGIKGYRVNWKKEPGSPDICFPDKRVAIFVHGCFWHRCPICKLPLPRTNTEFWQAKFDRNQERDHRKRTALEEMGWRVIVIWECQIKKDLDGCIEIILTTLGQSKTSLL